jgi:hypothetical protein
VHVRVVASSCRWLRCHPPHLDAAQLYELCLLSSGQIARKKNFIVRKRNESGGHCCCCGKGGHLVSVRLLLLPFCLPAIRKWISRLARFWHTVLTPFALPSF